MAGRTFMQLKKKMDPKGFNGLCQRVATEYARTGVSKATTYFTEKYNISVSCYAKIKEYAITHYLVSEKVIDQMREKAIQNQKNHASTSAVSTKTHYYQLRKQRAKYIFDLAVEYAKSEDVSDEELSEKHGRTYKGYLFLLDKALTGNYGVDMQLAKLIQIRMLSNAKTEIECLRINEYFCSVWQQRSSAKRNHSL